MKISIYGDNYEKADINIPHSSHLVSSFAIAPHKCGSVLLHKIVNDLANASNYPIINLEEQLFNGGFSPLLFNETVELVMKIPGYCFIGLRFPWTKNINYLTHHQKVLLVRDPRDVLVSHYFSMTNSHPAPGNGPLLDTFMNDKIKFRALGIESYIEHKRGFFILENMREFLRWSREVQGFHIFRYEDIIFNKRDWASKLNEILNMKVSLNKVHEIADRQDIVPTDENPDRHIRQVRPGNYRKHLLPEHIKMIEDAYPDLFEAFSY